MSYRHEVFISYRRAYGWERFVSEIFHPLLLRRLDCGDNAAFLDTRQEEPGLPWPREIALGMSRSKLLVVLWTRQYYDASVWCKTELDFFLERERGSIGQRNLIIPIVINHPDSLHEGLKRRSPVDLCEYSIVQSERSSAYENLERIILKTIVPAINKRLDQVPDYDAAWDAAAVRETERTIEVWKKPVQRNVPTLATNPQAP